MLVSASHLSKSYEGTSVLKDVTFSLGEHDHMAIIGVNGAGKSTLLRLLTGEEDPDGGSLSIPSGLDIGYLRQNHRFDPDKGIYETLAAPFAYLKEIEQRLRELEDLMGSTDNLDKVMKEYDTLTNRFEHDGGYAMTSNIKGVLAGLGFDESEWHRPVGGLSGGEKTRLGLGQLLLSRPDVLLLDEPTNHLDLSAIEWLENYLRSYDKALIAVSHDRYFIDRVTTSIMEIEGGKSTVYNCHYDEYATIKKHNRDVDLKHYLNNQKELKRMQQSIDTLKAFNREKSVKRAESKEKALAKMERVERPSALPEAIRMQFSPAVESGHDVLHVDNVSAGFGREPLFDHVSFDIAKGERVALVGDNGIGKTTLFRVILQDLLPLSGRVQKGVKVMIGYYDQEQMSLSSSKSVFDEISDTYPTMTNTEIRSMCAAFQFKGDDVFKTIDVLSGGERGRVVLMKLLLHRDNFLILDEPTNHLDIQSKEVLEDALLDFEGTILFISHDRYFINKIATRVMELTPHGIRDYQGDYDYYMAHKVEAAKEKNQSADTAAKTQNLIDRKTRNRIKKVEEDIATLEETLKEKEKDLASDEAMNDYNLYNDLTQEIETLNQKLEALMDEWADLQED